MKKIIVYEDKKDVAGGALKWINNYPVVDVELKLENY